MKIYKNEDKLGKFVLCRLDFFPETLSVALIPENLSVALYL